MQAPFSLSGLTIAGFSDWLQAPDVGQPYAEQTQRAYGRAADGFLAFLQDRGVETPGEANLAWIRLYQRELRENGLAEATIRLNLSAIGVLFDFWRFQGFADENPVTQWRHSQKQQGRRGGRPATRLPPVLQHHEREALMDVLFARKHVNRERDLALVGLLLDSGLRGSEATTLLLRDGRGLVASGSLRVIGKGNKERLVRPMPTYRGFLEDYLEKRSIDEDRGCLFPSRRGARISGALLHHFVQKSLRSVGIEKSQMGPHLLRHTAASRMLAAGENLRQVQEFLGHSSLLTTSKYVHLLM